MTTTRPETDEANEAAVQAARDAYRPAYEQGLDSDIASCADWFGWHAAIKAAKAQILREIRDEMALADLAGDLEVTSILDIEGFLNGRIRALGVETRTGDTAQGDAVSTQRAVQELQKTAEYLNAKAARRTGEVAEALRQAAEVVTVRATVLAAEPTDTEETQR